MLPSSKIPPPPVPDSSSDLHGLLMEVPNSPYDLVPVSDMGRTFLFQEPLGYKKKSPIETNQLMPGSLPLPNSIRVQKLRCVFLRDKKLVPITDPLWLRSSIEFDVTNRVMLRRPTWMCAHPAAFLLAPDALTKAAVAKMLEEWETAVTLNPEVIIEPGMFFSVILDLRGAGDGIEFCVILDGPLLVGVV